jgi:hypothetical protein
LDKDPWSDLMAASKRYVDVTPLIINASTGLVAHRYNTATENSQVGGSGNYFVIPATGMVLTLPASPVLGDKIKITDIAGTAFTTPVNIARNGERIQGLLEDLLFNVANQSIKLVYSNTTYGWRLTA